jgi:hypothetical protein
MLKTYLLVLLKVMRGVNHWDKDDKKEGKNFIKELEDIH